MKKFFNKTLILSALSIILLVVFTSTMIYAWFIKNNELNIKQTITVDLFEIDFIEDIYVEGAGKEILTVNMSNSFPMNFGYARDNALNNRYRCEIRNTGMVSAMFRIGFKYLNDDSQNGALPETLRCAIRYSGEVSNTSSAPVFSNALLSSSYYPLPDNPANADKFEYAKFPKDFNPLSNDSIYFLQSLNGLNGTVGNDAVLYSIGGGKSIFIEMVFWVEGTDPLSTLNLIGGKTFEFSAVFQATQLMNTENWDKFNTVRVIFDVGSGITGISNPPPTDKYLFFDEPYGELPYNYRQANNYNLTEWRYKEFDENGMEIKNILITETTPVDIKTTHILTASYASASRITYDARGGTLTSGSLATVTTNWTSYVMLPTVSMENKSFAGWFYINGSGVETNVTSTLTLLTGSIYQVPANTPNLNLYAKFV